MVVVDKPAYETCKAPEGAFEYNSGDDTIPLKKRENFFICTKCECCEINMKMKIDAVAGRGVNVRPNPRTRHEPDTGFFGLGLGLNGFGS